MKVGGPAKVSPGCFIGWRIVDGAFYYPLQLCTQKAEAMAVSTVMMKLMIVFQFSFFIEYSF